MAASLIDDIDAADLSGGDRAIEIRAGDVLQGSEAIGIEQLVIEQGAFVVNVDTTGLNTVDEKADLITQRIQETFAILAKELANR